MPKSKSWQQLVRKTVRFKSEIKIKNFKAKKKKKMTAINLLIIILQILKELKAMRRRDGKEKKKGIIRPD